MRCEDVLEPKGVFSFLTREGSASKTIPRPRDEDAIPCGLGSGSLQAGRIFLLPFVTKFRNSCPGFREKRSCA